MLVFFYLRIYFEKIKKTSKYDVEKYKRKRNLKVEQP